VLVASECVVGVVGSSVGIHMATSRRDKPCNSAPRRSRIDSSNRPDTYERMSARTRSARPQCNFFSDVELYCCRSSIDVEHYCTLLLT
jgi:hypothetical protein